MPERNAVILVDHRTRDLMAATLIAHHMEARGVRCHLEPLEAYYSCLAAHHPDLIIFNHINSSHLVKYSQRLHELNVLTAVLPNEGILYTEEILRYNSGRFHKGSHMDFYFCWNEIHQRALQEEGPGGTHTRIEVCGVPRFDFYFEPWAKIFRPPARPPGSRPQILLCTNMAFARFAGLSDEDAAKFFAPFRRIPLYDNYRENINTSVRSREMMMKHLEALAATGEFDVLLRIHPREELSWYEQRLATFPPALRERIQVDSTTNFTELVLGCDLEISCETCTTGIEGWLARKPSIELAFDRSPIFFHEKVARLSLLCDDPGQIVEMVRRELAAPDRHSSAMAAERAAHLQKWCDSPSGRSCEKVAAVLAEAVLAKPPMKRDYTLLEKRKGFKLRLLNALNLRYNFAPMLPLKVKLKPADYSTKWMAYRKTIRPSDVREARAKLANALKS